MDGVVGLLVDVEGHGVVLPVGPEGVQVESDVQEICAFCFDLRCDFEFIATKRTSSSLSQHIDIKTRSLKTRVHSLYRDKAAFLGSATPAVKE